MPRHPLHADDRAVGLAIIGFFAMLVVGALLFILLDPAISQLTTTASSDNPTAQTQVDLASAIWDNILFVPLFVGILFLTARAVLESRAPGGGGP
jgi:hypothetical protein